jgi:MGT family glycosyltransferase
MMRKALVLCEGIWLAHTSRPLLIARALRRAGWDVHFGCAGRFSKLPEAEGFPVHHVATMDPERALKLIRQTRIGYDRKTVDLYVDDELTLIERLKPDFVLNDFRLTVALSAALSGVPFVNILSAYWTNYYAPVLRAPADFPLTRIFGKGLATRLLPPVQRQILRLYARPFNAAAARLGLSPFGNIFDVMASPHLNLIADLEEFMPLEGAPEHFRHVGPFIWEPDVAVPDWLGRMDPTRPVVYFSMGSTGFKHYYRVLKGAFAGSDFQVMVTTGGMHPGALPGNFLVADMAPGLALTAKADVVVCHGGNGTIYQALYNGVPVIGMPTFHDQDFNMQRVEDLGLGTALSARKIDGLQLRDAARRLMKDAAVKKACEHFSEGIRKTNAAETGLAHIETMLAG